MKQSDLQTVELGDCAPLGHALPRSADTDKASAAADRQRQRGSQSAADPWFATDADGKLQTNLPTPKP